LAYALRWRTAPSHAAALFDAVGTAFPDGVRLLDPARGGVRVTGPDGSHQGASGQPLATAVARLRDALHDQLAPYGLAMAVDQGALPPRPPSALEAGVRRALDPHGVLNPPCP
jgi:hypothetical protein